MLEGVSAHQDTTTLPMASRKTLKPVKSNSLYGFLAHICWAVFASLFIMFAVNEFKLASSVKQSHSTAALPKSLSQNADSPSSSLPRSHLTTPAASYLAACTVSPNWSLISTAMSACLCLVSWTTKYDETVTVTSVSKHLGTESKISAFADTVIQTRMVSATTVIQQ